MSIQSPIPASARFNQVDVAFLASFNIPTPGVFDFGYYEVFAATAIGAASIGLLGSWPIDTVVQFSSEAGGSLDSRITPKTNYYVVGNVPAVVFGVRQVSFSLSPGGLPVWFSGDGLGNLRISPVYQVMKLVQGAVYFFERINVGGTIPQEIYLASIRNVPTIALSKLLDGQTIFPHPLPLVNFVSNQETSGYLWTDHKTDYLMATISGELSPNIDMVGLQAVSLFCQFNIYEIVDQGFVKSFGGRWHGANR